MSDLDPIISGKLKLSANMDGLAISYVACDLSYFWTWISVLSLDPRKAGLARVICVYVKSQNEISKLADWLYRNETNLTSKAIYVASFSQVSLEKYLDKLPAVWGKYIRINYIRSSRYKVAGMIQEKILSLDLNISSRHFVLDADHICLRNLERALIDEGIDNLSPIVVAWNSSFYNDFQYPSALKSGDAGEFVSDSTSSIKHAKSYITVKAGFMGLVSSSSSAKLFVDSLSQYAYGGPGGFNMRMFHFYYGDQLAIHMTLDEIYKSCGNTIPSNKISFIDLAMSKSCNLYDSSCSAIYMPKGADSTPENINKLAL